MTKFLKTSSIRLPQKRLLKVEEAAILESGSVPIAPLKMTMEDMTVKFAVYPWAKAAYIFFDTTRWTDQVCTISRQYM